MGFSSNLFSGSLAASIKNILFPFEFFYFLILNKLAIQTSTLRHFKSVLTLYHTPKKEEMNGRMNSGSMGGMEFNGKTCVI